MIYAVIDTNVIVSAYITKNLMAAFNPKFFPVYSRMSGIFCPFVRQ